MKVFGGSPSAVAPPPPHARFPREPLPTFQDLQEFCFYLFLPFMHFCTSKCPSCTRVPRGKRLV